VPPGDQQPNACSFGEPAGDGICAVGDLELPEDGPPVVTDPVGDVNVEGFTVDGFAGSGIFFFGAGNPVVRRNETTDNAEYGIARFVSSGGSIVANRASGSEEAGIDVGDSSDADVLIAANRAFDNHLFGFFLRDAANGRLVGNRSSSNCVGAIVLDTGSGPAGDWRFAANRIHDNTRFCEGDEEGDTPPLSGTGVLIANASNSTLRANVITGNVPSAEVPFSGGVMVLDAGTGAEPPSATSCGAT
jgi:parallel beta-helix repeat protein